MIDMGRDYRHIFPERAAQYCSAAVGVHCLYLLLQWFLGVPLIVATSLGKEIVKVL